MEEGEQCAPAGSADFGLSEAEIPLGRDDPSAGDPIPRDPILEAIEEKFFELRREEFRNDPTAMMARASKDVATRRVARMMKEDACWPKVKAMHAEAPKVLAFITAVFVRHATRVAWTYAQAAKRNTLMAKDP